MTFTSLVAALVLALLHVMAGHLRALRGIPRSQWLSMAGGVSVAYVFLHLLPELAEGQEHLGEAIDFLERHTYLLALVGLAVFYGLERLAVRHADPDGDEASVFWIHIGAFALYNAFIGYLLRHFEAGTSSLLLFTIAMALHFLVNDVGLEEHHHDRYERQGRWVLSAAILAGWGLGVVGEVPEAWIAALIAFLAGGALRGRHQPAQL